MEELQICQRKQTILKDCLKKSFKWGLNRGKWETKENWVSWAHRERTLGVKTNGN